MHTYILIFIIFLVIVAVGTTVWGVGYDFAMPGSGSTSGNGGGGGGGGSGGGGSDDNGAAAKLKLIAAEKLRILDNFDSIADYLPLLDDGSDNDYTITAVATCVGTNLAAKVASGDLDIDALLEQMKSPSLSDPNYSAIIAEETNCGYDELLTQAEHIAMYAHCADDGYCTVEELTDFFACFIGDGSSDNVDKCMASDNSTCPGECQPQDLARRDMRAKRRVELSALAAHYRR